MLKKRNLIFLSLLILGVLLLSSCFLNPPATEGILKGQIMVPEGTVQAKDLTGQALPDATVNIIDLATGAIIATTITDATGHYQVSVPPGGPYLLEAVKDEVKLQQITPSVEVGIDYDLGTADCMTTAVALIVQAMLDAGTDLADINLADIEADAGFDAVVSSVTGIVEAGGDPTTSAVAEEAVEDFLNPPTSPETPAPTPNYTVTYNGNGNTGGNVPVDSSNPYDNGATVTVLNNTGLLVKIGYTFAGWNTAANGSGTDQAEGSTFTMGASSVTLYAKWTANNYTITFDKNDNEATGTMGDQTIACDSSANLTACGFTKTGYHFDGWAATPSGTVEYADEASYTMGSANVILYAKWTINTYTVTFDKNGGNTEANPTTKTAIHGGNVGTLPSEPTKADYTFSTWNTLADGNGDEFTATTEVTDDITVYAQWISQLDRYVSTSGNDSYDGSAANPWLTIQHALDETPDGGTIHVADGTYTEKITFPSTLDGDGGRVLILKSENGADNTKINEIYNSGWFIVTFDSCPDGTILDGFTITTEAGEYTSTGGIYIHNCSPTIQYNTISGNVASNGGGIFINPGSPVIQYNTISGNTATMDGGGGISIWDGSSPIIQDNIISGNETTYYDGAYNGWGGGIYSKYSSPIIQDNTISGNTTHRGGAIYSHYGTLTIQNNEISGNTVTYSGGGIYIAHSTSSSNIYNNTISGNTAGGGGGISIFDGSPDIYNNTISGNTVTSEGGGISIFDGSPDIQDNDILENIASNNGGGIYLRTCSSNIEENTISGNTAIYNGGGIYITSGTSSPIIQDNEILENIASNNGGGIFISDGSPTIGGVNASDTGNFNTICGNTLDQISPASYPASFNNISLMCYTIGATGPAGGLIFYINPDYIADGWRYLEAAPSDQSVSQAWSNVTNIAVGTSAQGTAIGTGQENTTSIIEQSGHTESAANLCDGLSIVNNSITYDDWFLPSVDELNLMYTNLYNEGAGGFASDSYWSSSEVNATIARFQYFFSSTTPGNYSKSNSAVRVRAVRAF